MRTQSYTVLGWIVWQVGSRLARRKVQANSTKIGAAAAIALVVAAGLAAARTAATDS